MSRHFSARARIGWRSGVGVGIDAVSTTVERSFNGKSRRRSELVPCCRRRQSAVGTWSKTRARLTLERVARFAFCLISGTHDMCVCAGNQRAVEKEQMLEREACIRLKRSAAIFLGGKDFPSHPLALPWTSRAHLRFFVSAAHVC